MKSVVALEAQFKAELLSALRRAARGRAPTLFSLKDDRARSTSRRLRQKAERIMELRETYSVDRSSAAPAASYLAACLKWEHEISKRSVKQMAQGLLRELERHAT
jgi:hypothetical protein